MSRIGLGGFSRHKDGTEQDIELNLASIIDCFTVLITYLLASASFLSIGFLDVSVPTPSAQIASNPGPQVDVAIDLDLGRVIRVKVTGAETSTDLIQAKDGNWDFESLTHRLNSIKTRWPELKGAMVSAESRIEYKELVQAIEVARESLPSVALGEREI